MTNPTNPLAMVLVVVATLIGTWGALYFKLGADKLTSKILQLENLKIKELWIAVVCYGVSSIFFLGGLRGGDLSVLYPITSLTYIWVALLSMKVLKETMNSYKWLGIVFILIGVTVIGLAH